MLTAIRNARAKKSVSGPRTGNTLLTPQIIAREALMVLRNNMVFAGLVYRDYSNEFAKVGDTVTVRKPATFTAAAWNGSTVDVQDATESGVDVKMDTIIDVSFAVTSREMALSIQDFSTQFIQPAMLAHAQKLDEMLAALYKDIPYNCAVSATPAISDLAAVGRIMNQNKVPMAGRNLVVDPITQAKYVVLPSILNAEKSGSTDALRNASMGRVLGLDTYMDQNIASHTAGAGTVKIDFGDGYVAGTTEIHVDGVTTALKVGDLLTIANNQYVVKVAGALATADQDITIYPGLKAAVANDDAITVQASHVANLAFHKNAFALVTRPLAAPQGAAKAESLSFEGISVRVVYDYNMQTKTDTISLDFLCGVKTLTPELAVRLVG